MEGKKLAKALTCLFCVLLTPLASAESFRTAQVHCIGIPQDYSTKTVTAGIFDALSITLPKDRTFISGIEINIKIPEIIASWRDTVAYCLYTNLKPFPSPKQIDYSGEKLLLDTLPGKLNHTIYLPVSSKFNVKQTPYAKTIDFFKEKPFDCIFLRFLLAMKGAPESLENAELEITVKPVLSDEGYLKLNFNQPDERSEDFAVYIDDSLVKNIYNPILLSTGEHHLSVTSESYRNEVRTFFIEKAKTSELTVNFTGIEPAVTFMAPENTKISFDGQEITSKEPFVIKCGEHSVKFNIGDYEIQKSFTAVNGRTYVINLSIDATVTEQE